MSFHPKLLKDSEERSSKYLTLEYTDFAFVSTMTSNDVRGAGRVTRAGGCSPLAGSMCNGGTTLWPVSSDAMRIWAFQSTDWRGELPLTTFVFYHYYDMMRNICIVKHFIVFGSGLRYFQVRL